MSLPPNLEVRGVSISNNITIKRKSVIVFYITFP
nr:MAG TPA: hypothetical protein [Caudoviricetes sp.]